MSTLASVTAAAAGPSVALAQAQVMAPPQPPAAASQASAAPTQVAPVAAVTPSSSSQGSSGQGGSQPGYDNGGSQTDGVGGYQRTLVDIKI